MPRKSTGPTGPLAAERDDCRREVVNNVRGAVTLMQHYLRDVERAIDGKGEDYYERLVHQATHSLVAGVAAAMTPLEAARRAHVRLAVLEAALVGSTE